MNANASIKRNVVRKTIFAMSLAAGVIAPLHAQQQPLSFNAALVSDYRYRGISQTRLAPALQGGADYTDDTSGMYAGTWLSTIRWTRDAGGGGDAEWDLYAGRVGSALRASSAALSAHTVATRVPADLPLVRFDAVLVERVLCNLLENAGKYTPPGSNVTVSARVCEPWLHIAVEDDGPGLPPGQEESIFEKFTRGERESAKPGVGLGLAICRAIVEAHGGTIFARTRQQGGAAFTFTLPLGTPPAMPSLDDELETEEQDD